MMQQTLSAYLGALAVMGLLYGALSDSFGRRLGRRLFRAKLWLVVVLQLCAGAPGMEVIVSQATIRDVAEKKASAYRVTGLSECVPGNLKIIPCGTLLRSWAITDA